MQRRWILNCTATAANLYTFLPSLGTPLVLIRDGGCWQVSSLEKIATDI
jgi:hypothetical protein